VRAVGWIIVASLLAEGVCDAEPPRKHRVHWDDAWTHANEWDYTLAAFGATIATVGLTVSPTPHAHWTQPILFDADVRSALRVSDAGTRKALENAAWGLWSAQLAFPLVVDVPYAWARYGFPVARDLFWQDAVTLTIAGAIDGFFRDAVGRLRPDVYDCWVAGRTDCLTSPESTRSFPGGHLINSAAAAGLTCTQHLYMRLYGSPWDAITCATTITASFTVAMFRIMSDNHWATDQIVGGALGGFIGWFVPWVMHLHGHAATSDRAPAAFVVPVPVAFERGGGAGVAAVF
jgi:membrane-associated phospholipid phosphatase